MLCAYIYIYNYTTLCWIGTRVQSGIGRVSWCWQKMGRMEKSERGRMSRWQLVLPETTIHKFSTWRGSLFLRFTGSNNICVFVLSIGIIDICPGFEYERINRHGRVVDIRSLTCLTAAKYRWWDIFTRCKVINFGLRKISSKWTMSKQPITQIIIYEFKTLYSHIHSTNIIKIIIILLLYIVCDSSYKFSIFSSYHKL